jgi:hypothetical protein
MRFKGNERLYDTAHPGPNQQSFANQPSSDVENIGTIEDAVLAENEKEDDLNVEELEQTSKDYFGRGSQETDGAVPANPPDVDPLAQQHPTKPKGPPEHNM